MQAWALTHLLCTPTATTTCNRVGSFVKQGMQVASWWPLGAYLYWEGDYGVD